MACYWCTYKVKPQSYSNALECNWIYHLPAWKCLKHLRNMHSKSCLILQHGWCRCSCFNKTYTWIKAHHSSTNLKRPVNANLHAFVAVLTAASITQKNYQVKGVVHNLHLLGNWNDRMVSTKLNVLICLDQQAIHCNIVLVPFKFVSHRLRIKSPAQNEMQRTAYRCFSDLAPGTWREQSRKILRSSAYP